MTWYQERREKKKTPKDREVDCVYCCKNVDKRVPRSSLYLRAEENRTLEQIVAANWERQKLCPNELSITPNTLGSNSQERQRSHWRHDPRSSLAPSVKIAKSRTYFTHWCPPEEKKTRLPVTGSCSHFLFVLFCFWFFFFFRAPVVFFKGQNISNLLYYCKPIYRVGKVMQFTR